MPAPDNSFEHFQDTVRRVYNPDIRDWFSDVTEDEDGTSTPRHSLRTACLHQDSDSLLLTVGKMLLFEQCIRARFAQRGIGTTTKSPQVLRRGRPKIRLYFLEDLEDVADGYAPVDGEISFRLMTETAETLTETNLRSYATAIRSEFVTAGGKIWRKGKAMVSYADWEHGYQMQILARDKAAGKTLIQSVLGIQNHVPNWEFMNFSENEAPTAAYPIVPPTERILGRETRLPRRRPIADVRFQYAVCEIAGLPNSVCLVDRSGSFPNPLISA